MFVVTSHLVAVQAQIGKCVKYTGPTCASVYGGQFVFLSDHTTMEANEIFVAGRVKLVNTA